jgi:ATP-dependent helicase HrpA
LLRSAAIESFRWLVEEYRVSLFAQELGTSVPVSPVKLDRTLAGLQGGAAAARESGAPVPPAVAKPIVAAAVSDKKSVPIKNLGALDRLFQR